MSVSRLSISVEPFCGFGFQMVLCMGPIFFEITLDRNFDYAIESRMQNLVG